MIYGDWAATSPVAERVREAMIPWFSEKFGNPSSLHGRGQEAKAAVENARRQTAALIGAKSDEVFFTSCGTESSNWAIKGSALRCLAEGGKRKRLLVSAVEHPSVLRACEALAVLGFQTERIPVDGNGVVRVDILERMMEEDCLLAAVMHANNETGVIQPVAECARIAHKHGALFLCDAVQTVGHIPVDVNALQCDFLSLSGHKLSAPKGIGALCVREGIALFPLIDGGGQECGRRGGTENTAEIVGLGEACVLAGEELESGEAGRIASLRNEIEKALVELGGVINGGAVPRVPGISGISFADLGGENLMLLCDLYGVCISTGSACSLGHGDGVSHVLRAMGLSEEAANGSIRISIGRETSRSDAEEILRVVKQCVHQIRSTHG